MGPLRGDPGKRPAARFTGIYLAAWELPHACEVHACLAPRQQKAVIVFDNRGDDFHHARELLHANAISASGTNGTSLLSGRSRTAAFWRHIPWRPGP